VRYSDLTRRHFEAPSGAGTLQGAGVLRGAAGNRDEGTWVQFDLRLHGGRIEAARFLAFACPHTIAVADWVAGAAVGTRIEPALPETVHQLAQRFEVPIYKLGRLLIVEDAWLAAIRLVEGLSGAR
jgi:NifU-like protein involved in Fe-S cluster formation